MSWFFLLIIFLILFSLGAALYWLMEEVTDTNIQKVVFSCFMIAIWLLFSWFMVEWWLEAYMPEYATLQDKRNWIVPY